MLLKRIDRYIIAKFLGTYFLSILLIVSVAVVFDLTEKLDNFFEHNAPLRAIVLDYYVNFIPYFATLFGPLFVFIAVIFFTSKMAENTEIIAILAGGISFRRLMVPYFISATLIALLTFWLDGYVIPKQNITRLAFEGKYVKVRDESFSRNIQMEVSPGTIVYLERFDRRSGKGYSFSMDHYADKTLTARLTARRIVYDTLTPDLWHLHDYQIRTFDSRRETYTDGALTDSIIPFRPEDFLLTRNMQEQMTLPELRRYIVRQRSRGVGNITEFELEYHKRFAAPFAAFILTLIGVSLSAEKKRGGIGMNIGIGLLLSVSYLLFTSVSSTFSVSGSMPAWLAVWLPNILFFPIGLFLYRRTPK